MNIRISGNIFQNVSIPLLWGKRAFIQDDQGRLSIINLSGSNATLEVLFDKPARGVPHKPFEGGFEILHGDPNYSYLVDDNIVKSSDGSLPEVTLYNDGLKIGGATFRNNTVIGSSIGIQVTEQGFMMGGPLPKGLAELSV